MLSIRLSRLHNKTLGDGIGASKAPFMDSVENMVYVQHSIKDTVYIKTELIVDNSKTKPWRIVVSSGKLSQS